jgi:hypothetical protein
MTIELDYKKEEKDVENEMKDVENEIKENKIKKELWKK